MKKAQPAGTQYRHRHSTVAVSWLSIFQLSLGLLALGTAQAQSSYVTPYTFTTLAGFASRGSADGIGAAARFYEPSGSAVDAAGNIYIADTMNCTIRKITSAGVVSTLAGVAAWGGTNDGLGAAARFEGPQGVAVDSVGNVYVADTGSNLIRKITPAGVVTTLAGSPYVNGATNGIGSDARFSQPAGIAVDGAGNVYVADSYNNTIRKITPVGVVSTFAGSPGVAALTDGTGGSARFNYPCGLTIDGSGNLYVADCKNNKIRKIISGGVVTTLATSSLAQPRGVTVDAQGNLYIADTFNQVIRKITQAGVESIVAGSTGMPGPVDGIGTHARFSVPHGIAVSASGEIYVGDTGNSTVRKIISSGTVTTLAGYSAFGFNDGQGASARFNEPLHVAVDEAGNVFVADKNNSVIRKITSTGLVSTLAGSVGSFGYADGVGSAARFGRPTGIAVDRLGNVYVADQNAVVRKITAAGNVSTLAGSHEAQGSADGSGASARFQNPLGLAVDGVGNVYVADTTNCTIRKITPAGIVTTLAGSAGQGDYVNGAIGTARFKYPSAVAVDTAGNIYVADEGNAVVRKIVPSGVVTTLAGTPGSYGYLDGIGSVARFNNVRGIAIGSEGSVYITEQGFGLIRKITADGVVSTLAGSAFVRLDSSDGTGEDAHFNEPTGIALDGTGKIYIADSQNNTIRRGILAPPIFASAPSGSGVVFQNFIYSALVSGAPTNYSASGLPAGLTINSLTGVISGASTQVGTFAVQVNATNSAGVTSKTINFNFSKATAVINVEYATKVYNGSVQTSTATTSPLALNVTFTYNGSYSAPTNAGIYSVVASVNDPRYQGEASGLLVITKAPAVVLLSGLSAIYNGSPQTVIATTIPAGLSVDFSPSATQTEAGAHYLNCMVNDANYHGFASGSLVIAKASATITMSSLAVSYDGSAHALTAATTPVGLAVSFTYNGSAVVPSAVGSYVVNATINNPNYTGNASAMLTISKATPVINWTMPAAINVGTALSGTQLNATTSIPGTIVYDPAVGIILGVGVQTLHATFTPTDSVNYESVSASTTISVQSNNSLPVFTIHPASQSSATGFAVALNASAEAIPAPTYQWQKEGINISGATASSYIIQSLSAGDVGLYRVIASNSVGSTASNSASITMHPLTKEATAASDFNSDGKADVIWQNRVTGERYIYLMNGANFLAGASLGTVGLDWNAAATGDFNGDGKTDVVWENRVTGERYIYLMSGTTFMSGVNLGTVPPEWWIVVAADFNGDGKTDIIWENRLTGEHYLYLMNGTTVSSAVDLGTVSLEWTMGGAGDFTGDGKPDLLWQNIATGEQKVQAMNGTVPGAYTMLGTYYDLQIAGSGDFNNDGKADILLTNLVTGERTIRLMNGVTPLGTASLGTVGFEWVLNRQVPLRVPVDFNADGRSDVVWQNNVTGERYVYLMNGVSFNSGYTLILPASIDWKVAASADFNRDGKPDLVGENIVTGERCIWLMNAGTVNSTVSLGTTATQWSIAAATDMNSDGQPDVVWQNTSTGARRIDLMNGTTVSSTITLTLPASNQWRIAATADFNRDGKPDLVGQNTTSGESCIWLMNGSTVNATVTLGAAVGSQWSIATTVDLNSDGYPDVLWQNTVTGERYIYLMNYYTFVSAVSLGTIPTPWSICR